MLTVVILGSGDLAATLARRLAERELARRVVMVDASDGRARGKALDLMQSAPVEGYDVAIEGCAELAQAGRCDALVLADHPALEEAGAGTRASELAGTLAAGLGDAALVVASASSAPLIEAAVARGVHRTRVLGSAPVAFASALRRHLARELETEPRAVSALVLGRPGALLLPQGAATVAGLAVDRLAPAAGRRALAALDGHAPGPVALAAAAAETLRALFASRASVLPVTVMLDGEYGHRGVAMAVPARLGGGRVQGIVEAPLEPVDRTAFDNAASRRPSHR
jgi:malate dehydrogenase